MIPQKSIVLKIQYLRFKEANGATLDIMYKCKEPVLHMTQGICIRNMEDKKMKDPFCGDTSNSLAKVDIEFHWSRAYHWYSELRPEDVSSKCLRIVGLVKVGCIPKVFSVPYCVL